MARVTSKDLKSEIIKQIAAVNEGIEKDWFEVAQGNLVPTVFVGTVSARKWHVGWCYAERNTLPGDLVKTAHPEEFTSTPGAAAIFVDGYWKVAPIVF